MQAGRCAGAEWDSVIYIGSGFTEALSRAKFTLGIITLNCFKKGLTNYVYEELSSILNGAVEEGLLKKAPENY